MQQQREISAKTNQNKSKAACPLGTSLSQRWLCCCFKCKGCVAQNVSAFFWQESGMFSFQEVFNRGEPCQNWDESPTQACIYGCRTRSRGPQQTQEPGSKERRDTNHELRVRCWAACLSTRGEKLEEHKVSVQCGANAICTHPNCGRYYDSQILMFTPSVIGSSVTLRTRRLTRTLWSSTARWPKCLRERH